MIKNIIIKNLLAKILVLSLAFCIVLCGCGFKGPLYLPKKTAANSNAQKPASSPTAASSPKGTKVNSSSTTAIPNGII